METHTTFQLIYDRDCPFCAWYSNLFVKFGFLRSEGRISYQEAVNNQNFNFDEEKAKNKIALISNENHVSYGIDSLLKLIGSKIPLIATIGFFKPIHFLLSILYAFVSYNRKAFAPSECNGTCDCYPSKSIFWRLTLVLLAGLYVNYVTWIYFTQHLSAYFISDFYWLDSVFYLSQFAFQFVVFKLLKQKNFYDYAGQIAVISFLGAVALQLFHVGLVLLAKTGIDIQLLEPFCYGIVYLFMLYEHKKRIKILGFTAWMSVSWVVFRFLIYPFAFQV